MAKENNIYKTIQAGQGWGYYDSEMRNRIVASVEAAHDHVRDVVAL